MIEQYTYKIEGTTGNGDTWSTTGIVQGDIATPEIHATVMLDSFQQLTRGRAVFGNPGAGCRGPYTITRFLLERVRQ